MNLTSRKQTFSTLSPAVQFDIIMRIRQSRRTPVVKSKAKSKAVKKKSALDRLTAADIRAVIEQFGGIPNAK